jgi:hypothetical protein
LSASYGEDKEKAIDAAEKHVLAQLCATKRTAEAIVIEHKSGEVVKRVKKSIVDH